MENKNYKELYNGYINDVLNNYAYITKVVYLSHLNNYVKKYVFNNYSDEFNSDDIVDYIYGLYQKGLKQNTSIGVMVAMFSFLKYIKKENNIKIIMKKPYVKLNNLINESK